jgi:hypothetical protein
MSEQHPSSDPPFFFRRVWDPSAPNPDDEIVAMNRVGDEMQVWIGRRRDMPEHVKVAGGVNVQMSEDALVIYGRKIVSRYPEDEEYLRMLEAQGSIFTECFSVAAPTGEIGSHPVRELTEISREEFEAARARGWT